MAVILIIDDSPFQRSVLRGMVREAGYATLEAEEGQSGLELAVKEQPDCVLADLLMPNMGGLELLEGLRERGLKAPVIIVTSHTVHSIRQQCLAMGAAEVIAKPVDKALLTSTLRKVLPAAPLK